MTAKSCSLEPDSRVVKPGNDVCDVPGVGGSFPVGH
jgi:hypothetical protein